MDFTKDTWTASGGEPFGGMIQTIKEIAAASFIFVIPFGGSWLYYAFTGHPLDFGG